MIGRRLLALACAFALVVAGCGAAEEEIAQAWIKDWALSHAVDIGKHEFGGIPSDDPGVNAILDGVDAVRGLIEADDLMDKGRDTRNPALMDQAMKKRPSDRTYMISRGALALEMGYLSQAQDLSLKAMKQASGDALDHLAEQEIREVQQVADRLSGVAGITAFHDRVHCNAVYQTMLDDAKLLEASNKAPSREVQSGWKSEQANCATLFP